jgi:hypothetical protein
MRALILAILFSASPAFAGVDPCATSTVPTATIAIELTPTDVGSSNAATFSTLPTDDPALFGLTGADVRGVDFDLDPNGNALAANSSLTNQYSSLGVDMNDIRIDNQVYQGPASPPNATEDNAAQIYTFTVPVTAVGIINTSPDRDFVEVWSGPNATGVRMLAFRDQENVAVNFNIDRFLGARACPGSRIGSLVMSNASGDLELDELIFEVTPLPPPDAGVVDTGEADAEPLDAEAFPDAIVVDEAGVSPDAETPEDAGVTPDTGVRPDSGATADSGTSKDSTPADRGIQVEEDEGCKCNAVDEQRGAPWALLILLLLSTECNTRLRIRARDRRSSRNPPQARP